jgi:SAM-dependent methyltransferase
MSELQARNRAAWSAGDWDVVANEITSVGPRLLDRVGLEPGMRVLDVGTGSGSNVAIPAAQRGAHVVGSDLTDAWFEAGRRRAAEAGVEIDWVLGDAQELPFEDGSFDRVLSTFGHMFAPHHRQAAQELVRVCKPGGSVGFTTWLTTGFSGRMFAVIGMHAPPPPPGVQPPPLWGDREHVRETLAPLEPEFAEDSVVYEWDEPDGLATLFIENFGPLVTLRAALAPEQTAALDADFRAMLDDVNEATDGSLKATADYLVTIVRK